MVAARKQNLRWHIGSRQYLQKGTAVALATTTKRVQQQKGYESLRAWGRVAQGGGQRKEASLLVVNIPQMSRAEQGNTRISTSGCTGRFLGPAIEQLHQNIWK